MIEAFFEFIELKVGKYCEIPGFQRDFSPKNSFSGDIKGSKSSKVYWKGWRARPSKLLLNYLAKSHIIVMQTYVPIHYLSYFFIPTYVCI